jgi:hypothetical protein
MERSPDQLRYPRVSVSSVRVAAPSSPEMYPQVLVSMDSACLMMFLFTRAATFQVQLQTLTAVVKLFPFKPDSSRDLLQCVLNTTAVEAAHIIHERLRALGKSSDDIKSGRIRTQEVAIRIIDHRQAGPAR